MPLNHRSIRWGTSLILAITALAVTTIHTSTAEAFCGFYVSGASEALSNNATQVVMMRDGMRTVLSMQNSYQGPPEDFALVIPVPVVLQKEDVKTLDKDSFQKIDQMAAPRLVEYWETDPCYVDREYENEKSAFGGATGSLRPTVKSERGGVTIEAQFKVGEYEIVILSAKNSGGLTKWLKDNKYNIPKGAESVLRPYVEQGTKFFVAKVDVKKVKFEGNKAVLSPLRFHYDTKDFNLPIRLGLLNANGPQDLIVHILARNQRYEVANYKNVTIPTNLKVDDNVKEHFAEFYAALFDETLKQNPNSVVTEYSWAANTCDPCPGPALTSADFLTFGADALKDKSPRGFVLTRLHARYTKDKLGEDLVFKAAPPLIGGRGTPNPDGLFTESGSKPGGYNNFQGRYAILHRWEGKVTCQTPDWGRWGGPPPGKASKGVQAAQNISQAPRGKIQLAKLVREDVPSIKIKTSNPMPSFDPESRKQDKQPASKPSSTPTSESSNKAKPTEAAPKSKDGCTTTPTKQAPSPWLALLALGFLWKRTTKR